MGSYIWRILIDKSHQSKGHAKQAIEKIIAEIKTMPHGEANYIYTSWSPENIGSKVLFESFGFKETKEAERYRGLYEADDNFEVVARLEMMEEIDC